MKIEQRLLLAISKRKGVILLRKDVATLGSQTSLSRALATLVKRGKLAKIGYGVYAKTRISTISGNPIPDGTLEDLAYETLVKIGITPGPGFLAREYNAGRSTQIPVRITFNTDGKRVARELRWGSKKVYYECERVKQGPLSREKP